MYIGVTIGLQREFESIWMNGIKMNAIFLVNVLKQTGHKVVLLDTSQKIKEMITNKVIVGNFPILDSQVQRRSRITSYSISCAVSVSSRCCVRISVPSITVTSHLCVCT